VRFPALLLAAILIIQVTTPAFCMTHCLLESAVSSCGMNERESCCTAEKPAVSQIGPGKEFSESTSDELPCNECCLPICSVPLFCCYYQEFTDVNFSVTPVLIARQLPSSNGTPVSGYPDRCFQPPEVI